MNDEAPAPFDWVETLVERAGFPVGSRGTVVEKFNRGDLMVELEGDTALELPVYAPTELVILPRHRSKESEPGKRP